LQTGRTIPKGKLESIIRVNKKFTFMSIQAGISGERNVAEKEAEKIVKV
jgi:hypothetical protein